MSLIVRLDQSASYLDARTRVLQVLSRCKTVNSIVVLLSINFHQLDQDVMKEHGVRRQCSAARNKMKCLNTEFIFIFRNCVT